MNVFDRLEAICEEEKLTKEQQEQIDAASKGSREALKYAQSKGKFDPVTYAAMKDDKEREEYAKKVPDTVKALTSKKNECKGTVGRKLSQKRPKNQFFRKRGTKKHESCAKNESRLIRWFNKCYSTDATVRGAQSLHESNVSKNGAIRFFTKKPVGIRR